jgi:hypothetical protein
MLTNEKERTGDYAALQIPNENDTVYGRRLQYHFRDLDCRFCSENRTCPAFCLCPYIIDALEDLRADSEFKKAVMAADLCTTPQRLTLIYLREGRL